MNFKELVLFLSTQGEPEDLIKLYEVEDVLTNDFYILNVGEDTPLLEEVVRTLTYFDLRYHILNGKFTLVGYKDERLRSFVRFFALLESVNPKAKYPLPKDFIEAMYMATGFTIEDEICPYKNWKVGYKTVEVNFIPSEVKESSTVN